MLPTVAVDGVGAIVVPVPPDALLYQIKVSDASAFVAVKDAAVAPWQ